MADGLLYVLSEPGSSKRGSSTTGTTTSTPPARTAFARSGRRSSLPGHRWPHATWMALYELPLDLLSRAEYTRLRDERSEREARIVENLAALDRSVYELIDTTDEQAMGHPAPASSRWRWTAATMETIGSTPGIATNTSKCWLACRVGGARGGTGSLRAPG